MNRTVINITQYAINTANAENTTDNRFTRSATLIGNGNIVNTRPTITYNGVPGECGIPNMYDVAINSPLSQNDTVAAIVSRYTTNGTPKTTAAHNLSSALSDMVQLPLDRTS
jgi:hypothetical protein